MNPLFTSAMVEVLNDRAAREGLKRAIREFIQLDPVDAAKDAETLGHLFTERCDQVIAAATKEQTFAEMAAARRCVLSDDDPEGPLYRPAAGPRVYKGPGYLESTGYLDAEDKP